MLKQLQLDFMLPVTAFLAAVGAQYSGLDVWLVRPFYDRISASWPYRSAWLTETLLHRGGRMLMVSLGVLLLVLLLGSLMRPGLRPYRLDLAYLFIAAICGPLMIGGLKGITHIASPWDLQIFGGSQPYLHLFDRLPAGTPIGHAFPSGHASGGFALFSLFFVLRRHAIRGAWLGILLPALLGTLFGFAQQARGAHFLSHDLMALAVCWLCSALLARLFYARGRVPSYSKSPLAYSPSLYQKEYS